MSEIQIQGEPHASAIVGKWLSLFDIQTFFLDKNNLKKKLESLDAASKLLILET